MVYLFKIILMFLATQSKTEKICVKKAVLSCELNKKKDPLEKKVEGAQSEKPKDLLEKKIDEIKVENPEDVPEKEIKDLEDAITKKEEKISDKTNPPLKVFVDKNKVKKVDESSSSESSSD